MLRALILLHRRLGISFCLLFAMWFSTGMVMHFVPFPSLTESERIAGLMPVDLSRIEHGPAAAVSASHFKNAVRVRLLQRSDGPVYLVSDASSVTALHTADLTDAAVTSEQLALAIAVDSARQRRMNASRATFAELANFDQWTVQNRFDPHRPLYRITFDDDAGSELYVSSATGEVVLDTTRRERWWNYVGSVAHWIYPTVLRSNWETVWTLSLVALVAAISGSCSARCESRPRTTASCRPIAVGMPDIMSSV